MNRLNLKRISLISAISWLPVSAFAATGTDIASVCGAACALIGCGCGCC